MASKKTQTLPVILPLHTCPTCRREHPKPKQAATADSGFLTAPQLAGYLGYTSVSTIYSKKSRGELPPTLPGRKSPIWDPCRVAAFLHTGHFNEEK